MDRWAHFVFVLFFCILFQLPTEVYRAPFRHTPSKAGSFSFTSVFTEQVGAWAVLKQVRDAP